MKGTGESTVLPFARSEIRRVRSQKIAHREQAKLFYSTVTSGLGDEKTFDGYPNDLNPFIFDVCDIRMPALKLFGDVYTRYRVRRLGLRYSSLSGSLTQGKIVMAVVEDPEASIVTGDFDMKVISSLDNRVEVSLNNPSANNVVWYKGKETWYWTKETHATADDRFRSPCAFVAALLNAPASTRLGQLEVIFDVEFKDLVPNNVAFAGFSKWTNGPSPTLAIPMGTSIVPDLTYRSDIVLSSDAGGGIRFTSAGTYYLNFIVAINYCMRQSATASGGSDYEKSRINVNMALSVSTMSNAPRVWEYNSALNQHGNQTTLTGASAEWQPRWNGIVSMDAIVTATEADIAASRYILPTITFTNGTYMDTVIAPAVVNSVLTVCRIPEHTILPAAVKLPFIADLEAKYEALARRFAELESSAIPSVIEDDDDYEDTKSVKSTSSSTTRARR